MTERNGILIVCAAFGAMILLSFTMSVLLGIGGFGR